MLLSQAKVVGDAKAIPVVTGRVTTVIQDRRTGAGAIRVGEAVRRRKFPTDLEPEIGTGRLWIVQGHFEVLTRDIQQWGKSSELFLVKGDLALRITKLTPHAAKTPSKTKNASPAAFEPDTLTWDFVAVVKPNDAQLEVLRAPPESPWY
jgi:hypothetical protein